MLKLALVGCGGMGRRHIKGLGKLREIAAQQFELVAAVDVFGANAEAAAGEAEALLGRKPRVFSSFAEAHATVGPLDAIIVTTAPDLHAAVGIEALDAGVHVMVEKPIALTVKQGISLVEAARRNNRKLAVAENYRRDPMNRLAKALLDAGAIGRPHLMIQSSSGSGERVIITPWRHKKQSGGIVVDMGIHYADLLEYFLGPIDRLFGFNSIVDKKRVDTNGVWHDVDAEDLSVGVTQFASGAIGNWVIDCAGRGTGHFTRIVYGSDGSLDIPHDRSGREVYLTIRRDGKEEIISPAEQLAMVPEFKLDPVTATLFGGDRLPSYQIPFVDIDANLLSIEQDDFANAIIEDRAPEVDGEFALRSLAISYGFLDAELLGHAVEVNTLLRDESTLYQTDLNAVSEVRG